MSGKMKKMHRNKMRSSAVTCDHFEIKGKERVKGEKKVNSLSSKCMNLTFVVTGT